ncbi:MAG: phosphoribosyltransferase family protein [Saprospiraceae bacterium]|nr:ComF family protein [Lewinella sp.]
MISKLFHLPGQGLARYFTHLLDLLYPRLCLACSTALPIGEEVLCLFCRHKLPVTDYHLMKDNPFSERFWGRLPLHSGTSLYHFNKGGKVQHLIHELKYHHQPEIGRQLGKIHGRLLKDSPWFSGVQLILPVPLHPRKQHKRGYNQSAQYAVGLAEGMEVPWSDHHLFRTNYTDTQTAKSRLERFDNVREVFALKQTATLENKHVLLVDDVITTGATLEACGQHLLQVPGLTLSMATIAFAS